MSDQLCLGQLEQWTYTDCLCTARGWAFLEIWGTALTHLGPDALSPRQSCFLSLWESPLTTGSRLPTPRNFPALRALSFSCPFFCHLTSSSPGKADPQEQIPHPEGQNQLNL